MLLVLKGRGVKERVLVVLAVLRVGDARKARVVVIKERRQTRATANLQSKNEHLHESQVLVVDLFSDFRILPFISMVVEL